MAQQVKKKKKIHLQCRIHRSLGFNSWVRKILWRRKRHPFPYGNEKSLPEKSHGQRSLMGYSPWSHKESNMTEQLSTMGK